MTGLAKKIVPGLAVLVGVVLLGFGGFICKMKSETGKMTPLETGKVIGSVYAVKDDFVNFYIVGGKEGYVAFDAGNGVDGITAGMKKIGVDPATVKAVFLTHGDSDHAGGLGVFKNATIYISAAEEQMVNGKTARFGFIHNRKLPAHEILADRQTVRVAGLNVQGVLTPGHTPGSMCYIVNGIWMFSGDTMSLKNGRAGLFNDFFNMDSGEQKKTLTTLAAKLKVKHIFTAHYGHTDAPAGALAPFAK